MMKLKTIKNLQKRKKNSGANLKKLKIKNLDWRMNLKKIKTIAKKPRTKKYK